MMLTLANARNGLVYPHDDVCWFQSQFAHHAALGYFRIDSMPYSAIIHLLRGGTVRIVDATGGHKLLTDALRYGVPTWCLTFNTALGMYAPDVCEWVTLAMIRAATSNAHHATRQTIRKLARIYGSRGPAIVGENVQLICYRGIGFDDRAAEFLAKKGDANGLHAH